MSGDVIRYGIIGSGLMGFEHIRNIALLPDAELTAIADPHEPSRRFAMKTAGHEIEVYTDHQELLAKAPVDVVVISSPNHTHAAILDDVLMSDVHVLVEKPLCTTIEDCQRVNELVAKRQGIVQVGMEYRYMPPVARLIEEAAAGTAGRIRMVAIREHRFPFLPKVGDWNRFNRNTGGTLVEKCCHFFDLMNLIVGEKPLRVYASGAQDVNHLDERYDGQTPDILDNAFTVVDYEGGCRAMLDLCMFAEASRNEQEIAVTGDAGKLECFVPEATVVLGRRDPKQVETLEVPTPPHILEAGFHQGATYYQHEALLRAIRSGGQPEVNVYDGLLAVAVGAAAERSVAEERPVELSELGV
jgi:myo-inositol 2-dehydrogenase/D-chiro-inositol 1-dehydrogenase